jgi:hypothetical protein
MLQEGDKAYRLCHQYRNTSGKISMAMMRYQARDFITASSVQLQPASSSISAPLLPVSTFKVYPIQDDGRREYFACAG